MQLVDTKSGDVLLDRLEFADTFFKRFKGLQFRRWMPENSGLLLSPCSSLHTCFMRFSIDVVMLDRENVVLGTKSNVPPWRAVICDRGTRHVLEVRSGTVTVVTGTKLAWMDP